MNHKHQLSVIEADITTLDVDVIVNAANNSLLGGGGVDGAIHRAAGKELLNYCRTLNGCETGEVKLTPAFNLPMKAIIHTVGPIWRGGNFKEQELLENCYQNALVLVSENNFNSIAFPCISTGIYGFPFELATKIAIKTCKVFIEKNADLKIIFCCFSETEKEFYKKQLTEI